MRVPSRGAFSIGCQLKSGAKAALLRRSLRQAYKPNRLPYMFATIAPVHRRELAHNIDGVGQARRRHDRTTAKRAKEAGRLAQAIDWPRLLHGILPVCKNEPSKFTR